MDSENQLPKAKQQTDDDAADDDLQEDESLSDLEMERRRLMARNRAKLMALGISVGLMELQDLSKREKPQHKVRPRSKQLEPAGPTRRSTRLAGGEGADQERLLQLGEHGGAEVQGAEQQPAEKARAEAAVEGLTEEEIAAKADLLRTREASRLRELELEGLVDLSPEAAVFVVIGSTGNHYTVRLSDAKRSCQCMDCRVRKRDCKHIRLILGKLQIEDQPSKWYEAVDHCFHASAAAAAAAADESAPPRSTEAPSKDSKGGAKGKRKRSASEASMARGGRSRKGAQSASDGDAGAASEAPGAEDKTAAAEAGG